MNGLEYLKNVKRLDEYKNIPVIMFTTVDNPEVVERANKLGAAYYIIKPFTEDKMSEVLKAVGIV